MKKTVVFIGLLAIQSWQPIKQLTTMKTKSILRIEHAHSFRMGTMTVKQPLPARGLNKVGPFILLHHAGPKEIKAGANKFRIDPHPHRGFQPVTFIFSGEVEHYDSKGHHGLLGAGDVQWMNAGSGIVHSEGPPASFFEKGGVSEIIQLWVNLPKSKKMSEPSYQDIKKDSMPVISENNGKLILHLVAGNYNGLKGPAVTASVLTAMTGYAEEGAKATLHFPKNENTSIYVLEGKIKVNEEREIEKENLVVFDNNEEDILVEVLEKAKLLILSGEPINEPMVSHGPFVMNTIEEISEAMDDYEAGKMGVLTK